MTPVPRIPPAVAPPVMYPSEGSMSTLERRAWHALEDAANAMFALPAVHPADNEETARDIHNLQNRLLARLAYPERTAT